MRSLKSELEKVYLYKLVKMLNEKYEQSPAQIVRIFNAAEKKSMINHWLRDRKPEYLGQETELEKLLFKS